MVYALRAVQEQVQSNQSVLQLALLCLKQAGLSVEGAYAKKLKSLNL